MAKKSPYGPSNIEVSTSKAGFPADEHAFRIGCAAIIGSIVVALVVTAPLWFMIFQRLDAEQQAAQPVAVPTATPIVTEGAHAWALPDFSLNFITLPALGFEHVFYILLAGLFAIVLVDFVRAYLFGEKLEITAVFDAFVTKENMWVVFVKKLLPYLILSVVGYVWAFSEYSIPEVAATVGAILPVLAVIVKNVLLEGCHRVLDLFEPLNDEGGE